MASKQKNASNKKNNKQTKGKKQQAVSAPAPQAPAPKATKAKGGKGSKKQQSAPAPEPVVVEPVTVTEPEVEAEVKKGTRSFKVMLPDSEEYCGRFTGKTPYQAANKALSKYYRETDEPDENIQFSIKESTRGSAKRVYHYTGERFELDSPVEYTITNADGEQKTITKNFKNRLEKIKKAQLAEMLGGQATESVTESA